MKKISNKTLFYPNYVCTSVLELSPADLRQAGITHLALDVDETLLPDRHDRISAEYRSFLRSLEQAGFKLLIASNTRRDIASITEGLNAQVVLPTRLSFKPLKSYYRKVIAAAGTSPEHVAIVGDKILQDIIGANAAGLTTILVEPYARRPGLITWLIRRRL